MNIDIILFFGLGVALEAFTILRKNEGLPSRENLWKFFGVFIISLVAFIKGKREVGYHLDTHLFGYFVMVAVMTVLLFQEKILPVIKERTMLVFTLVFWYLLFAAFGQGIFLNPLLSIPLAFTVMVFLNAFTDWELNAFFKISLTVWFFLMVLVMSWMTVVAPLLGILENPDALSHGWEAFAYGISFVYFIAYYIYLFLLIPIPGKRQSMKSRLEELRKYVSLLLSKYDRSQIQLHESLLVIVLAIIIFGLNIAYHFMEPVLLVSSVFVLYNLVEFFEGQKAVVKPHQKA